MTYQHLLFEVRDRVAFATINRPDKLNALNDAVMADLGLAAEEIATRADIGGAIITGMWRDTSDRHLRPELLAAKYTDSAFHRDPQLHEELARWMDHTRFSVDRLRGYDFYDLYHWEHRMTKWGGAGYAEYDLATTPAPVLSSRRLLVAALSLPKPQRESAEVYRFAAGLVDADA